MSTPTHVEEFGNLRAVVNSDGRKSLMLPTGGSLWIAARAPYPEIDVGTFEKSVVNPNVFFDARYVAWAKSVDGNIVIGTSANFGDKKIFHSTNNGTSFSESRNENDESVTWEWVKQIGDRVYVGPNLRVSTDGGATFERIATNLTNLLVGIAFNPFTNTYLTMGATEASAFLPAGRSTDGINFTPFNPIYSHDPNGAPDSVQTGLEFHNGYFYTVYGPHRHQPPADLTKYGSMFRSQTGTVWDEIQVDPQRVNGPLFEIGPGTTFMISSPTISSPQFHYQQSSWDWGLASDTGSGINTTADLIGGWLDYAHGHYWLANNYQREAATTNPFSLYGSSDICIAPFGLAQFIPTPVFSEFEWNVSAKCVDGNGDLLVFEKGNDGWDDPGIVANVIRLVKITRS